jgi:acyl dehydratase
MAVRVIKGLSELQAMVGQNVGTSDWVDVTQARVQAFADGTGDHQWIHCDPERARRESPFGTTIAHGFFTLSLGPALSEQIYRVEEVKLVLNYGLNRVRFPNPVKIGSRVRMSTDLIGLKETSSGYQVTFKQTFEVEGETKPACVAEMVARMFF